MPAFVRAGGWYALDKDSTYNSIRRACTIGVLPAPTELDHHDEKRARVAWRNPGLFFTKALGLKPHAVGVVGYRRRPVGEDTDDAYVLRQQVQTLIHVAVVVAVSDGKATRVSIRRSAGNPGVGRTGVSGSGVGRTGVNGSGVWLGRGDQIAVAVVEDADTTSGGLLAGIAAPVEKHVAADIVRQAAALSSHGSYIEAGHAGAGKAAAHVHYLIQIGTLRVRLVRLGTNGFPLFDGLQQAVPMPTMRPVPPGNEAHSSPPHTTGSGQSVVLITRVLQALLGVQQYSR